MLTAKLLLTFIINTLFISSTQINNANMIKTLHVILTPFTLKLTQTDTHCWLIATDYKQLQTWFILQSREQQHHKLIAHHSCKIFIYINYRTCMHTVQVFIVEYVAEVSGYKWLQVTVANQQMHKVHPHFTS